MNPLAKVKAKALPDWLSNKFTQIEIIDGSKTAIKHHVWENRSHTPEFNQIMQTTYENLPASAQQAVHEVLNTCYDYARFALSTADNLSRVFAIFNAHISGEFRQVNLSDGDVAYTYQSQPLKLTDAEYQEKLNQL